jgi:hypothetical protein
MLNPNAFHKLFKAKDTNRDLGVTAILKHMNGVALLEPNEVPGRSSRSGFPSADETTALSRAMS